MNSLIIYFNHNIFTPEDSSLVHESGSLPLTQKTNVKLGYLENLQSGYFSFTSINILRRIESSDFRLRIYNVKSLQLQSHHLVASRLFHEPQIPVNIPLVISGFGA